jgi:hypothetical protein
MECFLDAMSTLS